MENPIFEVDLVQRLLKLGLPEEIIQEYAKEPLKSILQDDSEEDILR